MSMFLRVYSFGKEGAGINSAQTWKIKCEDNTVGVVLKYVYKFFENTPPQEVEGNSLLLECGLELVTYF